MPEKRIGSLFSGIISVASNSASNGPDSGIQYGK